MRLALQQLIHGRAVESDVPWHDGRTLRPVRAALLFTNDAGRPIRRTSWGDVWRPAALAAGAPVGRDGGFHALRHYFASLLIRHGESVKTVQARLGHASAAETLDTYSHLWPDSEDRTREAVDAVLGSRSSVTPSVIDLGPNSKAAGQWPSGERADL